MTVQKDIAAIRRKLAKPWNPQNSPPRGAYYQDFVDITNVPFGVAAQPANFATTVRTYTVPAQKYAVVRAFALDSQSPVAEAFVRFRFVINGAPGVNYQAPPVNFGLLSDPTSIWIEVEQQNDIALQLANLDDTTGYLVMTRWVLWTWDQLVRTDRD